MSLFNPSPTTIVRPNQLNGAGSTTALITEEYTGLVEQVIKRECLAMKFANIRTVRGTNTITKKSSGLSTIQKVVPGEAPAGTVHQFGKAKLTVDTTILTREVIPMLEEFQSDIAVRREIANAQGESHARKFDQSFFIAAMKAANMTTSPYGTSGFLGGTQGSLATASASDPSAVYLAISNLLRDMSKKDVVPNRDDVALVMGPDQFYALLNAEQIINGEYKTSDGTSLGSQMIFKTFGCPVFMSTNAPLGQSVTGHELSNADNSNFYDGDFTDDVILAVSPKAVMSGQTIPLTTKIWHSEQFLAEFVDAYTAFGMTVDRPEYAGVIKLV